MRTIIFDLDGTLVDSAGDLQAAVNAMLADAAHPPLDRETVIGFVGRGVEVLVRRVLKHVGWTVSEDTFRLHLARFLGHYNADPISRTTLYPGATELLSGARDRGFRMALCTNKPECPSRVICEALGVAEYFDAIVGGDTIDAKKPDPAPLLHAIELLGGTLAEALFVGDSDVDYLTAQAAGVTFVFVEGGFHHGLVEDFRPDHRVERLDRILGILDEASISETSHHGRSSM